MGLETMEVNYSCFFMLPSFKGNPPGTFYFSLFLLLSPSAPAVWVVSLIIKTDEFTTNNPQVGVISKLSAQRCLVRAGMLALNVSPDIPGPLAWLPRPGPHEQEGRTVVLNSPFKYKESRLDI